MTTEMPMRHPRAAGVQQATREVHDVLTEWRISNTTSDVEMLLALNAIEADVLRTLTGNPSTGATDPYGWLAIRLRQTQEEHGLTAVELLQALLLYGVEMSTFLLRLERHPDDPDRRGDEA